jgi:tRNA (guanine37-N1)-methyltransferase
MGVITESIIGRAVKKGILDISCVQIREFTADKHRRVDAPPYGGGVGMVMQADPIYKCYQHVCEEFSQKPHTIYMTPKGKTLTQQRCKELSKLDGFFIICGHYEGIDERLIKKIQPEEISIGNYVLTGGELPALVLVDAVGRLCDGVLSSEECYTGESHWNGLLEYPQYTRPEVWEGLRVPEVLLSGHHKNIEQWRKENQLTASSCGLSDPGC